jgi:predicted RNA-binding Zn ribbon-like protein
MVETPPTAANMRLDGGHPALDLVNTIYGQVGGPVEHDVLAGPEDLTTFARRVGVGGEEADHRAWRAAVALRSALDPVLRGGDDVRPVEEAAQAAIRAGRLVPGEGWTWTGPMAPVHRLAVAAVELLSADLSRLRCCDGCCWLYLDRSRNGTRRWCSMADCGTEAKKRRYVQRRRERRSSP